MRAKFVNEIKQDREGSGFESIGVGKIALYNNMVRDEMQKMWKSNKKLFSWHESEDDITDPYLKSYLIKVEFPKYNAGDTENIIYDIDNNTKKMMVSMSKKWGEELEEFGEPIIFKLLKTKSYGAYKFYMPDIIRSNKLEEFFDVLKTACEKRAGIEH